MKLLKLSAEFELGLAKEQVAIEILDEGKKVSRNGKKKCQAFNRTEYQRNMF